jgi:hypothetical protein
VANHGHLVIFFFFFIINFFLKKFNLKLSVNLDFYKKVKHIIVIVSLLTLKTNERVKIDYN